MNILLINPGSTVAMTESMAAAARAAAHPGTTILARTNHAGPPFVEGPEVGAASVPGLLHILRETPAHAAIIARLDDIGLFKARQIADCPVIGIGQAAYITAMSRGQRFSVVTTLEVSVAVLEENTAAYGMAHACVRVRASGVPVLDLETDPEGAAARITDEVARAVAEDGIDAVVLGCGGMVGLPRTLSARFGLPVIDGVTAAVHLAQSLASAEAGAISPA